MTASAILLIGAGGHSKSCIEAVESDGKHRIFGIIGLKEEVGSKILGYQVVGTDEDLNDIVENCGLAIISAGQIKSPALRRHLYGLAFSAGFVFPRIVARSAHVSQHSVIGAGTLVMPGAVVMPGVKIGINSIVNSQALVEHDAEIGQDCHISTGALINGGCHIGDGTFIGSGAIIKHGVNIGSNCVIGMGVHVKSDVLSEEVVTE